VFFSVTPGQKSQELDLPNVNLGNLGPKSFPLLSPARFTTDSENQLSDPSQASDASTIESLERDWDWGCVAPRLWMRYDPNCRNEYPLVNIQKAIGNGHRNS